MTTLYLVRHGQTEWSRSGKHTSITDLSLTEKGREDAKKLAEALKPQDFELILCSPRKRAQETAKLAGFSDFTVDGDLAEWFYGDYEGLTPAQIHAENPAWQIWTHGAPAGESVEDIHGRLERLIRTVRESGVEKAIVFAHGHILRALATAWLGLPLTYGAAFPLDTASISKLGFYHDVPALKQWNGGV